MSLKFPQWLFVALFLFASQLGFSQTNYLQNFSFENWSGSPEKPENWAITNENSISKQTDATEGNFALELDLNNSLSNKTILSTRNVSQVTLATDAEHTFAFDYKVTQGIGNSTTATLWILKDLGSYTIQYISESLTLNTDGNWHTYSFDFDTDVSDEDYVFELEFRANSATTSIVLFDNMRVLGATPVDSDNDGIKDSDDLCPNTPSSASAVDDTGCEVTIDDTNLLKDPSFEDWALNSGENLRDWGRNVIPGSSWNKNEDINDNLQYSNELKTADNGSNTASIFQNDIQIYAGVEYIISIDYKVLEGTFNNLELLFTQGIFADTFESFSVNPTESGWYTFSTLYTPQSNEMVNLQVNVISNGQQERILLDNTIIRANIASTDDDNDGVDNSSDQCPNTSTGETVDANGCSQSQLDDDNDGVTNDLDNCSDTPANTTVDANGCPIVINNDVDDDGVIDDNDLCPNTPTGETADANGCSESQLDDDNDGVSNDLDNCSDTPANTTVDANGCPVEINNDADDDGVTDDNDQCPNTPTGETVDANGCTITSPSEPNIPNESIQVKVSSTTCQDSDNGEISVSFEEDYSYTVQITAGLLDNTFNNINKSTGLVRSDLPADTYNICITIPIFPTFERCYTVKVEAPEEFKSGKININNSKKTGKLVVSGSKNYSLRVNTKEVNYSFNDTGNQVLSFDLDDGLNTIVASTDKECQGEYMESILLNTVRTYPNPTTDSAIITGIKNNEKTTITIYTINGKIIKSMQQAINDSSVTISLSDLPIGTYLVRIFSDSQDVQTKIVKK